MFNFELPRGSRTLSASDSRGGIAEGEAEVIYCDGSCGQLKIFCKDDCPKQNKGGKMNQRFFLRLCKEFLNHPSWWFFGWITPRNRAYIQCLTICFMIEENLKKEK